MKAKTPPIKNATIFSSNINDKKEMIIIIKDTDPENILTTKDSKKDIFILENLITKQPSIADKINPKIKQLIISSILIPNVPTGVFTVNTIDDAGPSIGIKNATQQNISNKLKLKITSIIVAKIDITKAAPQPTLNASLQILKIAIKSIIVKIIRLLKISQNIWGPTPIKRKMVNPELGIIKKDTISESIVAPKTFGNNKFLLKCLATKQIGIALIIYPATRISIIIVIAIPIPTATANNSRLLIL